MAIEFASQPTVALPLPSDGHYQHMPSTRRADDFGGHRISFKEPSSAPAAIQWLKYGEKLLRDKQTARAYYRCSSKLGTGCEAKKVVDFCKMPHATLSTEFRGTHNHPVTDYMESEECNPLASNKVPPSIKTITSGQTGPLSIPNGAPYVSAFQSFPRPSVRTPVVATPNQLRTGGGSEGPKLAGAPFRNRISSLINTLATTADFQTQQRSSAAVTVATQMSNPNQPTLPNLPYFQNLQSQGAPPLPIFKGLQVAGDQALRHPSLSFTVSGHAGGNAHIVRLQSAPNLHYSSPDHCDLGHQVPHSVGRGGADMSQIQQQQEVAPLCREQYAGAQGTVASYSQQHVLGNEHCQGVSFVNPEDSRSDEKRFRVANHHGPHEQHDVAVAGAEIRDVPVQDTDVLSAGGSSSNSAVENEVSNEYRESESSVHKTLEPSQLQKLKPANSSSCSWLALGLETNPCTCCFR